MGFNYESGEFTEEPHSMLPAQVVGLVCELELGDSAIVRDEAFWVDRSPERETWINGHANALTNNQVIAIGNSDPKAYARIHRVKKGLVLDSSHLDQRAWNWTNGIYLRHALEENDDIYPMPLIYCAFNTEELDLVKPALKKSGIRLKRLLTIPALMEAIDDAEEIGEDLSLGETDNEGDYED